MLEASKNKFSEMEEAVAQQALKKAYERETSALINHVRDRANSISELEDLWYLHDLLSTKRYEIDGKYIYNFPTIVFDFAGLVKEKWLHLDDLQGLKPEMLSKISALARM
jgi:Photoprotection regulator fluorescence recovery protein